MNFLLLKKYATLFILISLFNAHCQEQKLDNLKVEILKVSDALVLAGDNGIQILPDYGIFVMIKLNIENTSNEIVNLDFNEFYVVDELGYKYPFTSFYGLSFTKKKLKPGKRIKRIMYFDFPLDGQPKILLIHDEEVLLEE